MQSSIMVLGIDLGTSGVRIAIMNGDGQLVHTSDINYSQGLEVPKDWINCCRLLIRDIPNELRRNLSACSVDGTSGTILACDFKGNPLGEALPYYLRCKENSYILEKFADNKNSIANVNSSLARALRLLDQHGSSNMLLRHQADWISGWLTDNWKWGEEGNNIKLGWSLEDQSWPESFHNTCWEKALPEIVPSGSILSIISKDKADLLDLPKEMIVVAGTTDSNAAVIAANAKDDDGITVLGSTLVLKRFVQAPIKGVGITNHRIGGRWLSGGASNAGGLVFKKIFTEMELRELSRQINPELDSGLKLMPLPATGERFPIDDPELKPILEPRPVSDSLYLHGLLEGLARIEAQGWAKLKEMGAPPPKRIITLGGGAKNPQWRRIRERMLGIPVRTCKNPPALGVAHLALQAISDRQLSVTS